ncbi:hypothetical protein WME94_25990 [Sorangium sp. So ce429]
MRAATRALLEQELAVIRVRCDEPGTAVLLDRKPWFLVAGAEHRRITPREHVVVIANRPVISALIAGGATVITGTVLLFMKRPPSYRTEDGSGVNVELRGAASLDAAGLSTRLLS